MEWSTGYAPIHVHGIFGSWFGGNFSFGCLLFLSAQTAHLESEVEQERAEKGAMQQEHEAAQAAAVAKQSALQRQRIIDRFVCMQHSCVPQYKFVFKFAFALALFLETKLLLGNKKYDIQKLFFEKI